MSLWKGVWGGWGRIEGAGGKGRVDEQEGPGGEIPQMHQSCDLELSSSLCQAFIFTLLSQH